MVFNVTRTTLTSHPLLVDLIVTSSKAPVNCTRTYSACSFPITTKSHNLICATLCLKNKRPPSEYREKTRDRVISLLSIPSKIIESEVNCILVRHIFKDNYLASARQWAYRSGHSTKYLPIHLTETWRKVLDSGKFVAAAFIDFRKVFVSQYLWSYFCDEAKKRLWYHARACFSSG